MEKESILKIYRKYLPEEEFQNFDKAMFESRYDNDYIFVSAISEKSVIVCIDYMWTYDKNEQTKIDFPVLYKIIEIAKEINVRYIDFCDVDFRIDDKYVEKYNLKTYVWIA